MFIHVFDVRLTSANIRSSWEGVRSGDKFKAVGSICWSSTNGIEVWLVVAEVKVSEIRFLVASSVLL